MTLEPDAKLLERLPTLSARERDCLRLILENHTSKEVGRQLGISHTSVDTHVRRARAKLGLRDRYEAARLLAHWEAERAARGEVATAPHGDAPDPRSPWSLPPMEELGPWARIGLVLACAFVIALVFGVGLTAMLAL